ncbi:MAG: hypothetical protein OXR72_04240 [Gemmatimonadota bacterium]|nr:hypothetical protein [Gemmatimonadota bacterium]
MSNSLWSKWGDAIKVAVSFGSVLVLLVGVNLAVVQWMVSASESRLMAEIKENKETIKQVEFRLLRAIERIDERLDNFGERIAKNETRLNSN